MGNRHVKTMIDEPSPRISLFISYHCVAKALPHISRSIYAMLRPTLAQLLVTTEHSSVLARTPGYISYTARPAHGDSDYSLG